MNCMLCTAINKGNLSKREKEKARVLNVGDRDTEPLTAEVPLLKVKVKASHLKETVNPRVRVRVKVKARIMGERVPSEDALTVVGHTLHPTAQRGRVKARRVSSNNRATNPTHGGNREHKGLNIQCLNPSII